MARLLLMDEPDAKTSSLVPPVDLEIRITTPWGDGDRFLEYDLSSPSGAVDFHHAKIRGESIRAPETFQRELFGQLEKLHDNVDVDGFKVLGDEVSKELTTIGHDLYQKLFSPEMQRAYRDFRGSVRKLLITSDEPWIPWEILRPLDDEDDDFFCMKFRMSRWLAGEVTLPQDKHVAGLACFGVGSTEDFTPLPHAADERRLLETLAVETDLTTSVFSEPCFADVEATLQQRGLDLIHFVGHGDSDERRSDEAKIILADRPFRVRHLGALQAQLRQNRPMVFFNACRLAKLGQALTGNGGWAERWIKGGGASAFLAPFWSVDDGRALRFAEVFYEALQRGHDLGEAVFQTRHVLRREDRNEMAWLAYSLYGHPRTRVTFGSRRPKAVAATHGEGVIPESDWPALSPTRTEGERTKRHGRKNTGRQPPKPRSRPVAPWTVAFVTILVALGVVLAGNWPTSSSPATPSIDVADGTTNVADGSHLADGVDTDSVDTKAELSLPTLLISSPPTPPPPIEQPAKAPRREIPLIPMVAGKIGIVALDKESRKPSREVAEAIETVLVDTFDSLTPVILRLEDPDVDDLIAGTLALASADGRSRHGVEYLLVADAHFEKEPRQTSTLASTNLVMRAQLIAVGSGSVGPVNTTHHGLGHSYEEALAQAAERCLRKITDRLIEGGQS